MTPINLKETIKRLLAENGWTPFDELGTALANRMYATAVGPREAQAYLSLGGSDDPNNSLFGQYYSEGNNVLAAQAVLIPKTADVETVAALVREFVRKADHAIAESYARRLLLKLDLGRDRNPAELLVACAS